MPLRCKFPGNHSLPRFSTVFWCSFQSCGLFERLNKLNYMYKVQKKKRIRVSGVSSSQENVCHGTNDAPVILPILSPVTSSCTPGPGEPRGSQWTGRRNMTGSVTVHCHGLPVLPVRPEAREGRGLSPSAGSRSRSRVMYSNSTILKYQSHQC